MALRGSLFLLCASRLCEPEIALIEYSSADVARDSRHSKLPPWLRPMIEQTASQKRIFWNPLPRRVWHFQVKSINSGTWYDSA